MTTTAEAYRLPWSLNDNVLGWLEPTKRCNLACDGCYSRNDPHSDKSLDQIRSDLDVFVRRRKMDSISIAGGDPLIHPDIVEIVRTIRHDYGLKPVVNTNGLALDDPLLRELKRAGVFGFTFHVDSSQHRPGWKDADETALNALRLQLATKVAEAGGMTASFNATVFRDTLAHVPEMMRWAGEHIDVVNGMVFILFRTSRAAEFDYYAQGSKLDDLETVYWGQDKNEKPLSAHEVIDVIRAHEPSFQPAGYLGGTRDPDSFKWLIAGRLGNRRGIYGYVGPRFMEVVQTGHHALTGRYLAYSPPSLLAAGRSMLLAGSALDASMRSAAARWLTAAARAPLGARDPVHFQSVAIIQPIDMMPDGETNMCDGCPDMTVHEGELVWSCRLDERLQYGCFLTAAPKNGARPLPTV